MTNTFSFFADQYGTKKGMGIHRYTDYYELFFAPIRESAKKILEIGVYKGQSLLALESYFPNAAIIGLDNEHPFTEKTDRVASYRGDQANRNHLKKLIKHCGDGWDIIIDDGGHRMRQQQISLGFLFEFVKAGGIYIIEDVHTSLMRRYQDESPVTTLDMCIDFFSVPRLVSSHFLPSEQAYIDTHLENLSVMRVNGPVASMVAILRKKHEVTA